jgi:hypothetical protein
MHSKKLPIPAEVLSALEKYQLELGGEFNRQGIIHPRIHASVRRIVERINSEEKRTRLIVASYGYILVHKHEKVIENFEILELFDGAYGHLFYPSHHREALEKFVRNPVTFQKGESHGLHLGIGYAIIKIEIDGKYDPYDVMIH